MKNLGKLELYFVDGEPWFVERMLLRHLDTRNLPMRLEKRVDLEDRGISKLGHLLGNKKSVLFK